MKKNTQFLVNLVHAIVFYLYIQMLHTAIYGYLITLLWTKDLKGSFRYEQCTFVII